MEKYNLAYTGEHLEYSAKVLEKMASVYEKLSVRYRQSEMCNPVISQLKEIARLIMEFTGAYSREVQLDMQTYEDIERSFDRRGIKTEQIRVIERGDGHREFYLNLKTYKNKCPTTREVAGMLSELLGTCIIPEENNRVMLNGNFNEYIFSESGRFQIMHGVARRNKAGNVISGDTYSVDEISKGKTIISLADGMGAGSQANEDSALVIELVEEAVKAGFSEAAAIDMVNMAMMAKDTQGAPITVDMCVVDTVLGIANFIKLGAVATYIKRDGWVEIIQSETLPIGIFHKVDFDHSIKKLYAGDYIIIVSDGVLEAIEALDKEEQLMNIIAGLVSENPQGMAEEIIDKVLRVKEPNDDMTVIVAGIFARDQR